MTFQPNLYLCHDNKNATPIHLHDAHSLARLRSDAQGASKQWLEAHPSFAAAPDSFLSVPEADGALGEVLAGVNREALHIWSLAALPPALPEGTYRVDGVSDDALLAELALGWALAQYRYRVGSTADKPAAPRVLALPKSVSLDAVVARAEAIALARDLVNAPTNYMGPKELSDAARALSETYGASFHEIVGDDLLAENYPAVHAVGRASAMPPRLIELWHGKSGDPLLTLVGKGVCFDSGGLDVKPYSSMKLMKKDMGGAALVLGRAKLIMQQKLPVRLRVLIPAVENAIAGNAFRPQDVIATRKGLGVEIGSTDAEGRLILCDALTAAMEETSDLVIDAATLTGAARSALGTDLPAMFSNRDDIAQALQTTSISAHDPMWHMPLWAGYDRYVDSAITDITNSPNYGFAGAITAALYLQRFVDEGTPWVHIDSYSWNAEARPGRPIGGEALCLRALWAFLSARYAK